MYPGLCKSAFYEPVGKRTDSWLRLCSSAAEVLAHTDGSYEAVKELLPEALKKDGIIFFCYDRDGESCSQKEAVYYLNIEQTVSGSCRTAQIDFTDSEGGSLYRLTTKVPIARKAGLSE